MNIMYTLDNIFGAGFPAPFTFSSIYYKHSSNTIK